MWHVNDAHVAAMQVPTIREQCVKQPRIISSVYEPKGGKRIIFIKYTCMCMYVCGK